MSRFVVVILLAVCGLGSPGAALAQGRPGVEIAGGYQFMRDSQREENFPGGWFVSGAGFFSETLAVVVEIGGNHKSNDTLGTDVDVITSLGGLRFAPRAATARTTPFIQILAGAARVSQVFLPMGVESSPVVTEFALQPGGGIDIRISDRVYARAMVDYRRIFFETIGANEIRVAAGLVMGFGGG